MAEKLLKKCPKCRSDVFSGQRFCSSCGAEQEISAKTSEEIQEMRDLIKELCKKSADNHRGNISHLISSFIAYMGADIALKWAMGFATDEELHGILRAGRGEKNNHGI